jgi:hypothetical protein
MFTLTFMVGLGIYAMADAFGAILEQHLQQLL